MPDKANIELRKTNQTLQAKVDNLQREHDADIATIRGLQASATTVPVLPQDQLDQLYTVTGIRFGRLTGGYHPNPDDPADTMLKVYVVPTDNDGQDVKAAGTFKVELFDLALNNTRLGQWDFDLAAAKSSWHGSALMYTYVLDCPWQTAPTHEKLVARVTYTDALTHRIFSQDDEVKAKIAAAQP
jgi:hypothetical protein